MYVYTRLTMYLSFVVNGSPMLNQHSCDIQVTILGSDMKWSETILETKKMLL